MIYLAFKHLFYRKRQTFFTIIGIFFGSAAFVIISGFFVGFKNFMTENLVSGDAHIKITKNDEKIDPSIIEHALFDKLEKVTWVRPPNPKINVQEIRNPQGWIERAKSHAEVIAVGTQYSTSAYVSKAGVSISSSIIGTEPEQQLKITNIGTKMTAGQFRDIGRGNDRVVIGKTMADELSVQINDTVSITTGSGLIFPVKIVGFYETGNPRSDRGTLYTSLSTAQKIGGQNGAINQISIKTKDYRHAADIATLWKRNSRDKVESWDQANSGFLSMFQVQDMMRFLIILIILIVAGFGIYNILSMVVMQKRKDIAILRSMGFDDGNVLFLFLFQGVLLGAGGSLLGLIFGYGVCLYLQTLSFGPGGKLSIAFTPDIYASALFLGIGASCIAAYLPSRSASKLTPIEIIRSGAE